MSRETSPPGVYTDLSGLSALRAKAHEKSPEALKAVARQFESLFIEMMLKSMREAGWGGGIFDNDETRLYRDLFDKQVSMDLGARQDLGIAGLLARQLGGPDAGSKPTSLESTALARQFEASAGGPGYRSRPPVLRRSLPESPDISEPRDPWNGGESVGSLDSPAEFVELMWPYAAQAASRLGVAPEVLLAQSALESGWGQRVSRGPNGANSHNLFGIKADEGWTGGRVTVMTLEYEDGVPRRKLSVFRAYDSYADSFRDYVEFIRGNPRYAEALGKARDPVAYIQSLQSAGYATDPQYAAKVLAILRLDALRELKIASLLP